MGWPGFWRQVVPAYAPRLAASRHDDRDRPPVLREQGRA
jgi:hypothetical protein